MIDFTMVAAKPEQVAEVARLFATARKKSIPFLPTLHTPEEDLKFFETVFRENEVHLAVSPTKILGFIAFQGEWVNHLYVLPEAHGGGVGTALLAYAMSKGAPVLRLWTFQRNTKALGFYESHDFKIILRTNGENNEEREPDFLMEWRR